MDLPLGILLPRSGNFKVYLTLHKTADKKSPEKMREGAETASGLKPPLKKFI
jgi:hypothetical protein